MKTSIKNNAILATAFVVSFFAVGTAFTENVSHPATAAIASTAATSNANMIPTVVITAQRMSEDQKIAFDAEQSGIQTVVISAKHLTAQEKLAMDRDDEINAQRVAFANHRQTAS